MAKSDELKTETTKEQLKEAVVGFNIEQLKWLIDEIKKPSLEEQKRIAAEEARKEAEKKEREAEQQAQQAERLARRNACKHRAKGMNPDQVLSGQWLPDRTPIILCTQCVGVFRPGDPEWPELEARVDPEFFGNALQ